MVDAPGSPWEGELILDVPSSEVASRLQRAFAPETGDLLGKSSVHLEAREEQVHLHVSADSTANLRAALNSYLRWLEMALRVDRLATHPPAQGASPPASP